MSNDESRNYTYSETDYRLPHGRKYAARITLEHILAFGIADFLDYFACDERHVNVRFGFHFSSQQDVYKRQGQKTYS